MKFLLVGIIRVTVRVVFYRPKKVLWPLFHYILWDNATDGSMENKNWVEYHAVNKKFAEEILKIYQPGDISIY
jgi:trehalose-6-phosphate synthase